MTWQHIDHSIWDLLPTPLHKRHTTCFYLKLFGRCVREKWSQLSVYLTAFFGVSTEPHDLDQHFSWDESISHPDPMFKNEIPWTKLRHHLKHYKNAATTFSCIANSSALGYFPNSIWLNILKTAIPTEQTCMYLFNLEFWMYISPKRAVKPSRKSIRQMLLNLPLQTFQQHVCWVSRGSPFL